MSSNTEVCLRLFILDSLKVKASIFLQMLEELNQQETKEIEIGPFALNAEKELVTVLVVSSSA